MFGVESGVFLAPIFDRLFTLDTLIFWCNDLFLNTRTRTHTHSLTYWHTQRKQAVGIYFGSPSDHYQWSFGLDD